MIEIHRRTTVGVLVVCALALCANPLVAQVRTTYLYRLSNFVGPMRYDGVRVNVDQQRDEAYFVYQNVVRVFNASGMEIFSFGDDLDLGGIVDVAADANGDVILLSYKQGYLVTRCNFRGVPVGPIEITNLPAGVTFRADRLAIRNGLFYLADLAASTVTITEPDGKCRQRIDFASLIGADQVQKAGAEMLGFAVDRDGSIFFTMPTLFKVYKVLAGWSPEYVRPGGLVPREVRHHLRDRDRQSRERARVRQAAVGGHGVRQRLQVRHRVRRPRGQAREPLRAGQPRR